MANSDTPMGFRPVANLTGGGEYVRQHIHAAADNVAIGRFDLVTPTGTADTVEQYDNADPVLGVALNYVALSTLGNVDVMYLNHTSVLEAQEDSVGGAIAAASEGLNCDVIVAAASTTTGLSQMELDSNTAATTSTLAMRLLQPVPRPENTVAVANCKWFVSPLELHIAEAKAGI
jgi:hypothetical protein